MAKKSTPNNNNIAEILPNVKTKKKTECTGLFLDITKRAVTIAPRAKKRKIKSNISV